MKAVVREQFGGPENISVREMPKPSPGPGEVLVRVHASSVSRTDEHNLRARPYIMRTYLGLFRPKRPVLGTDLAGEVVDTGEGVTNIKSGDRVFTFNDQGLSSQAEYCVVKANATLLPIPSSVTYAQAAATLEGAHYAYSFLVKSGVCFGQTVLLNGATGAIGSALLQMLRPLGVSITATCRGEHADQVKDMGAQEIIDYRNEDFTRLPRTFDYVFDAVGKSTYYKCRHLLKPKGIYISSELGPYAQHLFLSMSTPLGGGKKVVFPVPLSPRRSFPFILSLLRDTTYVPLIDKVVDMSDAGKMYSYTASGQKTGSVVLRFAETLG